MEKTLRIVARAAIAALFIANGLNQLVLSTNGQEVLVNMGLPAPGLIMFVIILIELGGGLMFFIGLHTSRITLIMLGFWLIAVFLTNTGSLLGSIESEFGMLNMLKDIAVMGALLKYSLDNPGDGSLDRILESSKKCCHLPLNSNIRIG